MKLSEYLPRGTQKAFAEKLGVPASLVSTWASGERQVPIERCMDIEAATGGDVRVWDLRPDDWYRMWPMLVGAEGAPKVQKQAH